MVREEFYGFKGDILRKELGVWIDNLGLILVLSGWGKEGGGNRDGRGCKFMEI